MNMFKVSIVIFTKRSINTYCRLGEIVCWDQQLSLCLLLFFSLHTELLMGQFSLVEGNVRSVGKLMYHFRFVLIE